MASSPWSVGSGLCVVAFIASCGSVDAPGGAAAASSPPALDASSSASPADASGASASASCVSANQLRAWQAEIDLFDGGYRPTGSTAHEGYIALLVKELAALGVAEVHTEPYAFSKWTPSTWSLAWVGGAAGPIAVSGYIPYSGATGPGGVTTTMVHVPTTTIPVDATALRNALSQPTAWNQAVTTTVGQSLAALTLAGKIALFDVPRAAVTLSTVTGARIYANDPTGTLPPDAKLLRTDLSAMLYIPGVLNALAAAGAVGAIGILDAPEEAARGEYAPFFGSLSPNLPALYVDRATGAALKSAVAAYGSFAPVKLVLDAKLAPSSSENVIGVLPGASSDEILFGSHTDGPNSIEDNGPVAVLALATCLPASVRPRTVRFVLSGGHFVGSVGLQSYVAAHEADLTRNALAVVELEHLGARAWTEVSPGVMGLTGEPEMQIVTTWPNAPLVDASTAYAKLFPRTIVGEPPLIGEGPNFRIVPLIQILSMPEYLLLGHLPAITTQLTDYALMQRQVDAIVAMERTLAVAPSGALGVPLGK
jgi:hypothetical protein